LAGVVLTPKWRRIVAVVTDEEILEVGPSIVRFASVRSDLSTRRPDLAHGANAHDFLTSINWEALRQFACACLDFGFDVRIARLAVLGQAVQGFGDQLADLFEFGDPETA
jgi:hypothetical protein